MDTANYKYSNVTDLIDGGMADGESDSGFDSKQLDLGIYVEMEHTDDPEIAKEIAKDHLKEIPDYYYRLLEMEEKAEAE